MCLGASEELLVDSLRYCFNPHLKSGSEGQSKVSDRQEFPVSAQVTEEAHRGVLLIKSLRSSPRTTSKTVNSAFLLSKSARHSTPHLPPALSLITTLMGSVEDDGDLCALKFK